ncbi:AMP-binding protein [Nocardia sp. NPDC058058]|uniref:AMP-binding protein n=1 Tax=Nocardia sp. NPDC058058 TaxID=3346317 RepID=UPI0036DB961A
MDIATNARRRYLDEVNWPEQVAYTEHIQRAIDFHFSPETGSDFWIEKSKSFDFRLSDIRTRADLLRFPDVSAEWRTVPVNVLVPRAMRRNGIQPSIFESGGTTGAPKRIIDAVQWEKTSVWTADRLRALGAPVDDGGMMFLGPTGPHVVGYSNTVMARRLGLELFCIDLDPRFVRLALQRGHDQVAELYVEHVVQQAHWILESQDVRLVYLTPPIFAALATRPEVAELFRKKVRFAVWGSTSMNPDTLALLHEVFPDTTIIGGYGNTMMGSALEIPAAEYELPTFQAYFPYTAWSVLDEHREQVEYGERGLIAIHVLTPEVFLPVSYERDEATRIRFDGAEGTDLVQNVQPLPVAGAAVIEGVY